MNNFSQKEIVKAVLEYSSSLAEYKAIMDELEFGNKNIYNYPGLSDILDRNCSNSN